MLVIIKMTLPLHLIQLDSLVLTKENKRLKKHFYLILILVNLINVATAQWNNQWPMRGPGFPNNGKTIGLDFNKGFVDTVSFNCYLDYEFNASAICDSNGQLVMMCDGVSLANTQNTFVENGAILAETVDDLGNKEANALVQGSIILNGSSPLKYILLHMDVKYIDLFYNDAPWLKWDQQPLHVYANLVDMAASNGRGKVVQTIPVITDTLIEGQLTACRHANGRDWWFVTHKYLSNKFYITSIDENLSFSTHTQEIGSVPSKSDPAGQACFSPDGSKYCLAVVKGGKQQNLTASDNVFMLYDFDRCSGMLSNPVERFIQTFGSIKGCAFSPNGQFLYLASAEKVFQYEIATDELVRIYPQDTAAMSDLWVMQLAPDGKIYCGNGYSYITSIEYPNLKGDSCKLLTKAFDVGLGFYAVPTYPNYYLGALANSECDTITTIIEASDVQAIFVSPNPLQDYLQIKIINAQFNGTELVISDLLGRTVAKQTLLQELTTLPTQDWVNGMYVWSLVEDGRLVRSGKLVKE